jgi:hypothetical protein
MCESKSGGGGLRERHEIERVYEPSKSHEIKRENISSTQWDPAQAEIRGLRLAIDQCLALLPEKLLP